MLLVNAMLLAYLVPGFAMDAAVGIVSGGVQWVRFGAEAISILVIVIGILATVYKILRSYPPSVAKAYNEVRFKFSRYLVMALEFELAADIVGTAISPTWDQLGKLAVIATIRTFLNYFLQMEMREEKKETSAQNTGAAPPEGEV